MFRRFLDPIIKNYVEREFRDITSLVMKLTEGNAIELKRGHKYILAFDATKISKLDIVRLQSAVLKYFDAATIRVAIHGENGLQVIDVTDSDGKLAAEQPRKCRSCGCTDTSCDQCVAKTGTPCSWVEEDLCSACALPVKTGRVNGIPGPIYTESLKLDAQPMKTFAEMTHVPAGLDRQA